MIKWIPISLAIVAIFFVGAYLLLRSAVDTIKIEPGSAYAPMLVFQKTLLDPVPGSVRNLQGGAQTWQGYAAYLRFNVSTEDLNLLLGSGFIPADYDDVTYYFQCPDSLSSKFDPEWAPAGIEPKECYEMQGAKDGWADFASKWLIVDKTNNEVYFAGMGD